MLSREGARCATSSASSSSCCAAAALPEGLVRATGDRARGACISRTVRSEDHATQQAPSWAARRWRGGERKANTLKERLRFLAHLSAPRVGCGWACAAAMRPAYRARSRWCCADWRLGHRDLARAWRSLTFCVKFVAVHCKAAGVQRGTGEAECSEGQGRRGSGGPAFARGVSAGR